ncbi:hypothetical protein [Nocardia sp. AB354]|uniref:hypothetical protein n=1 Tax=Nocardia sp. AB354 TaxID=3413283 RepID=UPI003C25647D
MTNMSDAGWLPDELATVAFRLARVDQAAAALGEVCASWSKAGPIGMKQVERPDGRWDTVVTEIRPVPPLVSMLFSEAIHHLRAAIENTIFYLVEVERGKPLDERSASGVEMPIKDTPELFEDWQKRTGRKLPEVAVATTIGERIKLCQPFEDTTATVPSMSPLLAELTGAAVEYENPMKLLQRYSNTDKHRFLRPGAAQTVSMRADVPFWQTNRRFLDVKPGDLLATVDPGQPVVLELNPSVLIQRPDTVTFVGPVAELTHLHRHVADRVLPILVKGQILTRSLPPSIDLGDSGLTAAQRIEQGEWSYADERWADGVQDRMAEWFDAPPNVLPPPA